MTKPMVTMIACPECGEPIEAAKEHVCDPLTKALFECDSLRSRCEELEQENARLRLQADAASHDYSASLRIAELEDKCADLNAKVVKFSGDWARAERERNDARQWARKLYAENADLRRERDGFRRAFERSNKTVGRFRGTIATLLRKLKEARETLCRLEEAEYGMVGGNLIREDIPCNCVDDWFYYIHTGKRR